MGLGVHKDPDALLAKTMRLFTARLWIHIIDFILHSTANEPVRS